MMTELLNGGSSTAMLALLGDGFHHLGTSGRTRVVPAFIMPAKHADFLELEERVAG